MSEDGVNGKIVRIGEERRKISVTGFTATIVAKCPCGSKEPIIVPLRITYEGGGDIPYTCPLCKWQWTLRDIKVDLMADPPVFNIGLIPEKPAIVPASQLPPTLKQ